MHWSSWSFLQGFLLNTIEILKKWIKWTNKLNSQFGTLSLESRLCLREESILSKAFLGASRYHPVNDFSTHSVGAALLAAHLEKTCSSLSSTFFAPILAAHSGSSILPCERVRSHDHSGKVNKTGSPARYVFRTLLLCTCWLRLSALVENWH